MGLPLGFIYLPTTDVTALLHLYRDVLGYDELWREGDDTVGLAIPGNDVALMIDRVAEPDEGGPGPMFVVPSVEAFLADHPVLQPVSTMAIPDGMLASFRDPVGNWFYVLDQSTAA